MVKSDSSQIDETIESVKLTEIPLQTKISPNENKYEDNEEIKSPSIEIGHFFLEGISIKKEYDLYLMPKFNIDQCEEIKGNAVILTDENTAYFIIEDKIVIKNEEPQVVASINRQKIRDSDSTKPKKYTDSERKKEKIIKESTLKGSHTLQKEHHLLCTIEPIAGAFSLFILGKLQGIVSQCEKYIKRIQFNLQNKNTIEIEFLPFNSLEFYERLINFIDNLLDSNFKEITKISSDCRTLRTETKKYKKWIDKILIDQNDAFKQVIVTNQNTSRKKHYTALIEIDNNTLEYKTLAQTNSLNHITANSSLSDYSLQKLEEPEQKLVLKFGLHNLPQQENRRIPMEDFKKSLIILALESLDSIESFFKLLIRLRLLEMNILISVLKNTPDVIRTKHKSFLNKTITITQNSVGALATSKTTGSWAIGYNVTYLNNLLTLLCFKTFLIKETNNLLVYYALSDKSVKISPSQRQITRKAVSSKSQINQENSGNGMKGTFMELKYHSSSSSSASSSIISMSQTKGQRFISEPKPKASPKQLALQDKLIMACKQGDEKAVRALFQQGAKPDIANAKSEQPLGAAVWGMCPDVVNALLEQAGGVALMTWQECKNHNLKHYKEVFIITKFDPETFGEWDDLLKKIDLNPLIWKYHLKKADEQWHENGTSSWENFKKMVSECKPPEVCIRKLPQMRIWVVASQTEFEFANWRSQIKASVETAKQPTLTLDF